MADEPKSFREVNLTIDALQRELVAILQAIKKEVADFKSEVGTRFDGVNDRFKGVNGRVYWVIGLLVAGFVGGISLHVDVAKVSQRVDDLAKEVIGKIDTLQKSNSDLSSGQQRIEQIATRIEGKLPAQGGVPSPQQFTPLALDEKERATIREYITPKKRADLHYSSN